MNDILNPYIAGAPVLESSMFFGRQDVFGWIERSLEGKYVDHILVIHGQRRVGKTSVLKQIPNFLSEKYIQVFFDLQGRTNTSLERFLWWLAREIARTISQHGLAIPLPEREVFAADAETLLREFLPGLQRALGDRILLLTFDEFDILSREQIQETLARPLIQYLRRLMDFEYLNFIFSIGSSGQKLENMQAAYTDFFKAALYRKISFLTRGEAKDLITQPVAGVIEYRSEAVDRIIQITSAHPYFTQLVCHELFSLCQRTGLREITRPEVDSVMDDVIERGTVNLKYVWDEASDLEKWILAILAQVQGGVSNRQLETMLLDQHVRFSESNLISSVIHLRDKDVLTEDNQFVIYLMKLWLQRNRPLDRVREELVEVNPIANRYIEIGDEYRELGQIDKAIVNYRQALNVDQSNLRAQVSIASCFQMSGAYQAAVEAFEIALNIDEENVFARTGWCEVNLSLGDEARSRADFHTAAGFYEKVIATNPNHAEARQRLADIYRDLADRRLAEGSDEKALSALSRAVDYTPEDDQLVKKYHDLLEEKGDAAVRTWLVNADRALEQQQWDHAIEALSEAIRLSHEDASLEKKLHAVEEAKRQHLMKAYWSEAEQAREAESWQQAVSALEKYLELNPNKDEQLNAAGESLEYARRYLRINELYTQAQQALRVKRDEQAIELLQNVISQDPTYKDASRLLSEVVHAQRRAPLWRRPGLYAILGLVIVCWVTVVVGLVIIIPRTPQWIASLKRNTPVAGLATELFPSTPRASGTDPATSPTPSLRPSHSAGPTGSPTLAPRSKDEEWFLENVTVTDLSFFKDIVEKVGLSGVHHSDQFVDIEVTYLDWDLFLEHPKTAERIDFKVTTEYYRSDGSYLLEFTESFYIDPNQDSSRHWVGYGSDEPGWWDPGSYRADLYVGGQMIASGTFEIIEGIPTPTATQAFNLIYKIKAYSQAITGLDWGEHEANQNLIAVAGRERYLNIFTADTGKVFSLAPEFGPNSLSVDYSGDCGDCLGVGYEDGTVRLMRLNKKFEGLDAVLQGLSSKGEITLFRYSPCNPCGDVAVTNRGEFAVWDDEGEILAQFQISTGPVYDAGFNNDGSKLLVVSPEGLQIWDSVTWSRQFWLNEYVTSISASWCPTEQLVAIATEDTMDILNFGMGSVEQSLSLPEKVNKVAWSPDGALIATAGKDGTLRLWRAGGEGGFISIFGFEQDTEITELDWSPNGERIITGDAEGYIWLWQIPEELR